MAQRCCIPDRRGCIGGQLLGPAFQPLLGPDARIPRGEAILGVTSYFCLPLSLFRDFPHAQRGDLQDGIVDLADDCATEASRLLGVLVTPTALLVAQRLERAAQGAMPYLRSI